MKAILTSSIFNESFGAMNERRDPDQFFMKLSEDIALARQGKRTKTVVAGAITPKNVLDMLGLFKNGALMVIVLTKMDGLESSPRLSGWIGGGRLHIIESDGFQRVNGRDNWAFFDALGDIDLLEEMAAKYLTGEMHRFEDGHSIIWV